LAHALRFGGLSVGHSASGAVRCKRAKAGSHNFHSAAASLTQGVPSAYAWTDKALMRTAVPMIRGAWMAVAETKKEANAAFDLFVETYGVKYERAVKKLTKDRDVLLTFYDFPAEHWKHIRTTNPIESVFATVRNRTRKTKGCLSRKTALSMVFKLMMSAKKKWRKLSGTNRLPEVIQGVEFKDGIKQLKNAA
jgi:putative transposase